MDTNCQSCGLPMMIDADHGASNPNNPYCKYCTDSSGNLKSQLEIREGMINLYTQSFGKTRGEAEIEVDGRMSKMPAWQASYQSAGTIVPTPQPVQPAALVVDQVPVAAIPEPVQYQEPVIAPPIPQTAVPVAEQNIEFPEPVVNQVAANPIPQAVAQSPVETIQAQAENTTPVMPIAAVQVQTPTVSVPSIPTAEPVAQPDMSAFVSQVPTQFPADQPVVEPPAIPTEQVVADVIPSPFPVQEAVSQPVASGAGEAPDDGVGSDSEQA